MHENKRLYDYNVKVQHVLKSITQPLKEYFDLNFGYERVYCDARYFLLSDDLNFAQKFILNLGSDSIFCEKYIGDIHNKHHFIYTLWPKTPTDHPAMQMHFNAGYWNGMDVFYKSENYLELWWFSRRLDSEHYTDDKEFYLRNTETLTKFILYYRQKVSQLFDEYSRKDFATFKNGFDFSTAAFVPEEYTKISDFLQELVDKGFYINGAMVKFSPKEIECLKNLSLGKTTKETAKTLVLSPRTVESHINNIKLKTGYHLKSELIKLFQDNFMV